MNENNINISNLYPKFMIDENPNEIKNKIESAQKNKPEENINIEKENTSPQSNNLMQNLIQMISQNQKPMNTNIMSLLSNLHSQNYNDSNFSANIINTLFKNNNKIKKSSDKKEIQNFKVIKDL